MGRREATENDEQGARIEETARQSGVEVQRANKVMEKGSRWVEVSL